MYCCESTWPRRGAARLRMLSAVRGKWLVPVAVQVFAGGGLAQEA